MSIPEDIRMAPKRQDDYQKSRAAPILRSSKDFQKILGNGDRSQEDDEDEVDNELTEKPTVDPQDGSSEVPSLLSLAAAKRKKDKSTFDAAGIAQNDKTDSELAADTKLLKKPVKNDSDEDDSQTVSADDADDVAVKNKTKSDYDSRNAMDAISRNNMTKGVPVDAKEKKAGGKDSPFAVYQKSSKEASQKTKDAAFSQEQSDLAYLNTKQVNATAFTIGSSNAQMEASARTQHIQQLVSQMVDKLQVLEQQGKTETQVTLKFPPMFEGASLTLTSFDHASKEFNVQFENLSLQAKQVLDMKLNQDDLKKSLAEKGFTVHIIVTNTDIENRTFADSGKREESRREDDQQQGRNRKNKDQDA